MYQHPDLTSPKDTKPCARMGTITLTRIPCHPLRQEGTAMAQRKDRTIPDNVRRPRRYRGHSKDFGIWSSNDKRRIPRRPGGHAVRRVQPDLFQQGRRESSSSCRHPFATLCVDSSATPAKEPFMDWHEQRTIPLRQDKKTVARLSYLTIAPFPHPRFYHRHHRNR